MNISAINSRPNLYVQNNKKTDNITYNKQNIAFGRSMMGPPIEAVMLSGIVAFCAGGLVLESIFRDYSTNASENSIDGDKFTMTMKNINDSTVTYDEVIPTKSGEIHMPMIITEDKVCYGMPTGQGEITYKIDNSTSTLDTIHGEMAIETKSGNSIKHPFTFTNSNLKFDCDNFSDLAKKVNK